jgi:transcriptional regulator GlxA family with amidase domain
VQLAFVVYPRLTALDLVGAYEILRGLPGAELRFVAGEVGPVATDSGALLLGATHTYDETPAPDIVLVPGSSSGTTAAMADGALLAWLRRAHQTTRFTTSVCTGALILGAADLLRGHPATTHWLAQDVLGTLGATPQRDRRIVRSGKIATAAGVSAGIDLALWLVGEIAGEEHARMTQLMIEYDPQPPYDSGHPSKVPPELLARTTRAMRREAVNLRELAAAPAVLWRAALNRVRGRRRSA